MEFHSRLGDLDDKPRLSFKPFLLAFPEKLNDLFQLVRPE
jgi:hypothetical protein